MLRTPGNRRSVRVLRREPELGGVGMWAFGVRHIAALCGIKPKAISQAISRRLRGSVWSGPDPRILASVLAWVVKHRRDELERAGFAEDVEAALRVLNYLELAERRALGLVDAWTPEPGELPRPDVLTHTERSD